MDKLLQALVLASLLVVSCSAWGNQDEMEIYDLYEEVNGTFYELLGVSNSAESADIRRAYRKLSKEVHPDRNKAENAEEQFRQLVAVYEVLKDKEKRAKYDDVLHNGLPDWRQPMYYYRKYRKMGTLEISILVSLIFTIGHYLTWWVAYWEKRFEMNEVLDPVRKRLQKKKAKGKAKGEEDIDTDVLMERELGYRKPGRWDLLPFVLCRASVRLVKHIYNSWNDAVKAYKESKERQKQEEIEAEEAAAAAAAEELVEKPKRVKPKVVLRDASEFADEETAIIPGLPQDNETEDPDDSQRKKGSEWTDEDYAALAKSMGKFPGGTPGRWDRIAHELGRSAADVIKTVKNLKTSYTQNVATAGGDKLALKSKRESNIAQLKKAMVDSEANTNSYLITESCDYANQDEIPDDYDEGTAPPEEPEFDYTIPTKKTKVKTRPVDETAKAKEEESKTEENGEAGEEEERKEEKAEPPPKEEDIWSQVQQKCLEAAIKQFPKSTADRWTCIARAVPEKNKDQCIARFKVLAEMMKGRKKETSNG